MIYRPYKLWREGLLVESWAPGAFIYTTKNNCFHHLDCTDVDPLDSSKSVFLATFSDACWSEATPCTKCNPKSEDTYLQCLICGTFLPSDRGMKLSICRCGELEVDCSNPGLTRVKSNSNRQLSRHVSASASK